MMRQVHTARITHLATFSLILLSSLAATPVALAQEWQFIPPFYPGAWPMTLPTGVDGISAFSYGFTYFVIFLLFGVLFGILYRNNLKKRLGTSQAKNDYSLAIIIPATAFSLSWIIAEIAIQQFGFGWISISNFSPLVFISIIFLIAEIIVCMLRKSIRTAQIAKKGLTVLGSIIIVFFYVIYPVSMMVYLAYYLSLILLLLLVLDAGYTVFSAVDNKIERLKKHCLAFILLAASAWSLATAPSFILSFAGIGYELSWVNYTAFTELLLAAELHLILATVFFVGGIITIFLNKKKPRLIQWQVGVGLLVILSAFLLAMLY